MNNIRYELTASEIQLCESTGISFGIRCLDDDDVEMCVINDILPDRQKVEELVKVCNEMEVSPIHLPDIVEDFLP